MLIDFKCSNFYSFNEEVSFTTTASDSLSSVDKVRYHILNNKYYNKVSSLYGTNGSGKTTFLAALSRVREMVIHSSKDTQEGEDIAVEPFAFSDNDEPSHFEITFVQNGSIYRYGYGATHNEIIEEYLYANIGLGEDKVSKRETKIFARTKDHVDLGRKFISIKKFLDSDIKLRSNSLLLSFSSQVGHALAKEIVDWFFKLRVSFEGQFHKGFTASILENKNHKLYSNVLYFLAQLNLGFDSIYSKEIEGDIDEYTRDLPEGLKQFVLNTTETIDKKIKLHEIKTRHSYKSKNGDIVLQDFNFEDESDGVKKIFSLAGPIIDSLNNGYMLFIDEIETNLHFDITKKIIKMFNSDINQNGAQLIYTTHSPLLMDTEILERDQMWIISLHNGSTRFDRLSNKIYKVRKDTNIVQKIIDGEYNSAPLLEN